MVVACVRATDYYDLETLEWKICKSMRLVSPVVRNEQESTRRYGERADIITGTTGWTTNYHSNGSAARVRELTRFRHGKSNPQGRRLLQCVYHSVRSNNTG